MAKTKLPAKKTTPKKAVKKVAKKATKKTVKAPKKSSAKKTAPVKAGTRKKTVKKGKKKSNETLMCFLTTACVNYYGLKDDGYELNTLRRYRDTYLLSSERGKALVQSYYQISPKLVQQIEKDSEKKSVYAYIYKEVKSACLEIETNRLRKAKEVYTHMVKTLMQRYPLN